MKVLVFDTETTGLPQTKILNPEYITSMANYSSI